MILIWTLKLWNYISSTPFRSKTATSRSIRWRGVAWNRPMDL